MSAPRPLVFTIEGAPETVAFSPNDRTLLVTTATELHVRLSATSEKLWGSRFESVSGAVFSEQGRAVIAAVGSPTSRRSSVPSAERDLVRLSEDEARRPLDVALQSVLGATGDLALLSYGDGELGLFDLAAMTARPPFVMAERASPWTVRFGALSRDGALAVTSTHRLPGQLVSTLQVWDIPGSRHGRYGNAAGEAPVAISPNGKWVLYGNGRQVVLWNIQSGVLDTRMDFDSPLASDVTCAEFSSDGRLTLHGGGELVQVTRRPPAKGAIPLRHEGAQIRCARFSHDGRRVVTAAADGRVFLWDVA